MVKLFRRAPFFIAAAIMLFGPQSSPAQDNWKYSVNQYDLREVSTEQKLTIFETPCIARLKFICTQDSRDKSATGYLSLEFTISPASKVQGFDFGYFEGPDAPVGAKKLMKITLIQGEKRSSFQVPLNGWLSAEVDDGFTFGTGTPTRNKIGYMRKVVEAILAGADSIEVIVFNGPHRNKSIAAIFSVAADRLHFKAMMQGIK
ncbi:MAG: hypothetical protein ABSE95_14180 [Thermodesulfobacteriota bacterium]|jgi:hypothetical protein